MSHGTHRAPKSRKPRRLRRLVAGIGLAAAAAGVGVLTDNTLATPQQDTAWGASDLGHTVDVQPADTAWG